MENLESLLTAQDVAKLLNVEVQLVYRLKATKKIPFLKIGGIIRFRKADIEEWLEKSVVR